MASASEHRVIELENECARLREERDQYRKLYELTSLELQRIKRHLFGKKAETVDDRQVHLAFEKLDPIERATLLSTVQAESARQGAKKKKSKPTGRKPLPEELPVERIELPPPVDTQGLVKIGEEITETVEWRPGSAVRVLTVRPKYAKRSDPDSGVIIAEPPEKPIAKCKAGVGMLAHVIVSKHADHIPLNRQVKILSRQGLALSVSTLCGWLGACAELLSRITDAMHADALAQSAWIGTDATGVLVQAKGQCKRSHFWVMVSSVGHVLFRYTERHRSVDAHRLLEGYSGYVIADASTVYHELYRREDVTEVGCWAHCRRGFFESHLSEEERSLVAIGLIRKLYDIESELNAREASPETRLAERKARAGPVVQKFYEWVDAEHRRALPRSPFGKALQYALNQRVALERFLEDGRLRLDNNLSELELRRQVVGRKNWLFCGSDDAAHRNTVFVSLIASCERLGIEPWAYLRDVLSLLPRWKARNVLELAPFYWRETLAREDTQALLDADIFRRVSAARAQTPGHLNE